MNSQQVKTTRSQEETFKAIHEALECANEYQKIGLTRGNLLVTGLHPQVVKDSANEFKTRLFPPNDQFKHFMFEYEPFEGLQIKIIFISYQVPELVLAALKNATL